MSDHDDSAERTPPGGVPEWLRPIEYNEGLEDDDDEGPPEDLPDQEPQQKLFWFMNFGGELEPFDFDTAVVFYGKYSPHHDKILYNIPDNRWVLGSLDGLPGTATLPGVLATFEDIEVSREFATVFITQNDQRLPDSLRELADPSNPLREDPFRYPNIRLFYEACVSRSAGITSTPIEPGATSPEVPPRTKEERRVKKEPRGWEEEAYKMCELGKWTQREIAEILSKEFHIPIDQSKVSRAKDKVAAWSEEPKPRRVPRGDRPKKYNIDPQKEQHVIEDDRPLLAEQTEARAVPTRNGIRMRRKEEN